jgi:FkbM family methyltransferase
LGPYGRSIALRVRKPVYLYRPSQLLRRIANTRHEEVRVRLPWGDRLAVNTRDHGGSGIARLGIHELAVTETIFRLVGPGATVADVGANLGYFTSLLAHLVGPGGRVYTFEPHPVTLRRLRDNVANLTNSASVILRDCAVSDREGEARLGEPEDFAHHTGEPAIGAVGVPVRTTTLDAALPRGSVELIKIDVEGHEPFALAGAIETLPCTRHVVFEEHGQPPTPVTGGLTGAGFAVYGIVETFRGPRLVDPATLRDFPQWPSPTFLATRDPDVLRRVRPDGWRCLRSRPQS